MIKMGKVGKSIGSALGYVGTYIGGQLLGGAGIAVYANMKVMKEYGTIMELGKEAYTEHYQEVAGGLIGVMVAIAAVITILFLAILYLAKKQKFTEQVNLKKYSPLKSLGCVGIGIMLYLTNVGFLSILPESVLNDYGNSQVGNLFSQAFGLAIICNIFAAPILEEIIFRGLICDRLRKGIPTWLAVAISAALFSLAHGQPVQMVYTFAMGLVLGYIFVRTGSIVPTIIIHMVNNAVSTILVYSGLGINVTVFRVLAIVSIVALVTIFALVKKSDRKNNRAEVELQTTAA